MKLASTPSRIAVGLAELPTTVAHRHPAQRQLQSTVGRTLACRVARQLEGQRDTDYRVIGGGHSRPQLETSTASGSSSQIAISHCRRFACAAARQGDAGLGIDVQAVEPRNVYRLAGYMGWRELLGADIKDEKLAANRFFHLWTLWEAAVKCDGALLMSAVTPAFTALLPGLRPGVEASWSDGGYWAYSKRLGDGYWMSIISATPSGKSPTLEWLPSISYAGEIKSA